MKKIFAFLSVTTFAFVLVACSDSSNGITDDPDIDYSEETLTIWSFTDELDAEGDLDYFRDTFTGEGQKYEGMEVEYVEVPTEDFLTTLLPTLRTDSGAPDVFTGELAMLLNYMEGGYLADLEAMMKADEDLDFDATKADFVDYIWEAGVDPSDGQLKSLSWQVTPGGVFFKVDMAEAIWGDEAGFPVEADEDNYNQAVSDWVSENKFDTIDNLVESSKEVKAYNENWRLFPDDSAIGWFYEGDEEPSWIAEDGLINVDALHNAETDMEAIGQLYGESIDESLTANAGAWSGEWFQGMGKDFEAADGSVYQTMAYTLPTWGLFHVLEPNVELDENDEPLGNWGMASGPSSYVWGGTYLNIYAGSDLLEPSYDFLSSMLFDTDRMTERAANGDVYARHSVMDAVASDYEGNPALGGMNHYDFFMAEAEDMSLNHITRYDATLDELMGDAINDYKEGNLDTKEEAFQQFYTDLQGAHPEIYRPDGLPYQD